MKPRMLALIGIGILIPALAWAFVVYIEGDLESTAVAIREDFHITVEASGTLEAAIFYEVGPPSVRDFWNYNLTWMIPEGSNVQKGQPVARFDPQTLEDRLRDHGAELETATQTK